MQSYEQEMLLPTLSTSPSNVNEEFSAHIEHSEQWPLPAESSFPAWKRGHINVWNAEQKENMPNEVDNTHQGVEHEAGCAQRVPKQGGIVRIRSSTDLSKQYDSSDNSDVMDDGEEGGKRKTPMSKNLMSERKRRKKLNERLYALRALVPKISKMDKASIVSDAISYVRDLQKQVDEMKADITDLEARKDGVAVIDPLVSEPRFAGAIFYHGKRVTQEHHIVELEVSQMEEHIFHFHIHCKKTPGVLVQLTRALEALELEIINANLTLVDDHILNTVVVEVKNGWVLKTEELRKMALDVVPRFGFVLY